MEPMILELADYFQDIIFFVTSRLSDGRLNIINANSLTRDKDNLVELSYLSTFCDALIGRNSGPHVFSWTKENCFSNKINISFTTHRDCQHFVLNSPIKMAKFWSNKVNIRANFNFIKEIFEREL